MHSLQSEAHGKAMRLSEKIRQKSLRNEAKKKEGSQTKAANDQILISEEAVF
jgi:hypothetical protein